MKLSQRENVILQFLSSKQEIFWEELAQFCKDPATVKLKTVQKVVSDLKKKFKDQNLPVPFSCSFREMKDAKTPKMIQTKETVEFNGQKLVQIKRNIGSKLTQEQTTRSHNIVQAASIVKDHIVAVPDFSVYYNTRHIRTRSGNYNLNYDEFDLFNYLYHNMNRFISLEELRDKVCYPQFGSKLPARWFSAIQRRISNIRHQIPETRNRLLTAKQQNSTGYIFS